MQAETESLAQKRTSLQTNDDGRIGDQGLSCNSSVNHFLGELRRCAVLTVVIYVGALQRLYHVSLAIHSENLNFQAHLQPDYLQTVRVHKFASPIPTRPTTGFAATERPSGF